MTLTTPRAEKRGHGEVEARNSPPLLSACTRVNLEWVVMMVVMVMVMLVVMVVVIMVMFVITTNEILESTLRKAPRKTKTERCFRGIR
ncbi:hypothetical protein E2C01_090281 [Portunus trituberculatus]|uniref:Uncharacterized protein n=1 Tax=Portunus trituberculatus TaxID=210409 RepID=A0A5B7JKG6_PORTR|nr:hypothetical protein [Portunus trituberculatus]